MSGTSGFSLKLVFRREMMTNGKWPETGPGWKLGPILYSVTNPNDWDLLNFGVIKLLGL